METIGFKEWDVVCRAIASGKQDLLFRKGGIHEGRDGFSFKHEKFFLFPTLFHAQAEYVTEGESPYRGEWVVGDEVSIEYYCEAKQAVTLTSWEDVIALEGRHILTEQTLKDRFDWEGKGMASGSIHCAFLEVYKLEKPWVLSYEKKYGGCRSWIQLPDPPKGWQETMEKL